jgi:hypothetical protein
VSVVTSAKKLHHLSPSGGVLSGRSGKHGLRIALSVRRESKQNIGS